MSCIDNYTFVVLDIKMSSSTFHQARLNRESEELCARWGHLFHTWESQRLSGLPVPPLGPPPPPFATILPMPDTILPPTTTNVDTTPQICRRLPSRLPSFRFVAQPPMVPFVGPPIPAMMVGARQMLPSDICRHTATMARSSSASDVPPILRHGMPPINVFIYNV